MSEHCPHETQVNDPFHHTCKDCREQNCGHHQVALHVVKALIEDGEDFKARISPSNMKYLHLQEGDFLLVKGTQCGGGPGGAVGRRYRIRGRHSSGPADAPQCRDLSVQQDNCPESHSLSGRGSRFDSRKAPTLSRGSKGDLKEHSKSLSYWPATAFRFPWGGIKRMFSGSGRPNRKDLVRVDSQTALVFQEETGEGRRDKAITYQRGRGAGEGNRTDPGDRGTALAFSADLSPGWALKPPKGFCFTVRRVRENPDRQGRGPGNEGEFLSHQRSRNHAAALRGERGKTPLHL